MKYIPILNKLIVYGTLYVITVAMVLSLFYLTPNTHNDFPVLRAVIIVFSGVLLAKYIFYMLVSPWHDVFTAFMRRKFSKKIKRYQPLVSVMIPAWNEEVGILGTIESLLKSEYKNMELIVVNDGSTDNTDDLIRSYLIKHNQKIIQGDEQIKIVYIKKENGGKGAALNTAIEVSKGEILVSIDADCVVHKDAVKNFVLCFADPKVMAAVGNVKIGNTSIITCVIQSLEFLFSFYFKKADSMLGTIYIIGGAAGAFRKQVFDKIGVYNTKNITEDIDLSIRIQDAGMKIVYASDAVVYTEGASTIQSLMKQRLRWKRGRFETFADYKHLFFSKQKKHNKILSWFILPLALFGELQLSLELGFLAFLYIYSYLTQDYSSFIAGIVVVASIFFVLIFFDDKEDKGLSFYLLSPIGWLLFYLTTFVEVVALFSALWGFINKKEIKWQRWQRKGIQV